ncbi:hypothetical protein BDQ12DRAFT_633855 [Crucibulum laeve]|uniref:Uncharacterized protein n=1 Tax=Crucibulum laeve TaxID=68775 RepID=A0A5C3LWU1_9AGAR|nr:hypothetical protein BDQ12DRAFT_633855 [Crucibulum laeve]
MISKFTTFFTLFSILALNLLVRASPTPRVISLERRTDPFFPDQPLSCPICAKDYPSINGCAQAAPVLTNFTNIIFNPGAFIDVIKCACTDTFQATFPQCADCFIKTGQEDVLNTPDLPGVVDGMRKICALQSTLLGNVSNSNGETTPGVSAPVTSSTSNGGVMSVGTPTGTLPLLPLALLIGAVGLAL